MALCLHPTEDHVAVSVDADAVDKIVDRLPPMQWRAFEETFNYDGCRIPADEVKHYLNREPATMEPQQYIDLVLAASPLTKA